MLSLTKVFHCLTKNVNLKSRPSENLLADFCTSESSKNQPGGHALRIAEEKIYTGIFTWYQL